MRAVITSLGATSAFGPGVELLWRQLLAGRSAIRDVSLFPVAGYAAGSAAEAVHLPEASGEGPPGRALRLLDEAAAEALRGAGDLLAGPGGAVVVGTSMGGNDGFIDWLGRPGASSSFDADASLSAPAHRLSRRTGAGGPALTTSVACASGAAAIGIGADLIRSGRARAVLAGGVDALGEFVFAGFDSLRALSHTTARPFDLRRDGLVLGEGAAFVVLEEMSSAIRRGAEPLAIVAGYGSAGDAHHMTRPSPDGQGLVRAVEAAVRDAGASLAHVAFVSAHGTATVFNDRMEAAALRTLFGARASGVPVNSIKGAIGHTLGAAGALEAVVSALVLTRGRIPPTASFEVPDPDLGLDVVAGSARRLDPAGRFVLSTSSAFAGTNVALVLERV